MSRWKKGEREFQMNVNHNGLGSHLCRIPKPVMELMGNPKTVKFVVKKGNRVTFVVGDEPEE